MNAGTWSKGPLIVQYPDHHQCLLIYQIKVKVKIKLKANCFDPGIVPVAEFSCKCLF